LGAALRLPCVPDLAIGTITTHAPYYRVGGLAWTSATLPNPKSVL